MKLFNTRSAPIVEESGRYYAVDEYDWDALINHEDLSGYLKSLVTRDSPLDDSFELEDGSILPPLVGQEVWAAGVTYFKSRDARMEEAEESGGSDFYGRVYDADRPELFFKATAHRVASHGENIRIRSDSRWNVPEPELTLIVNARGRIVGYTIGNDVSSRDIEGENPLYLPQAKVYDRSCALGPAILIEDSALPSDTKICVEIFRDEKLVFEGKSTLKQMKRTPNELVEYLYRETSFPAGSLLMTGTGIVPDSSFTLQSGDEVQISIDRIGTLRNCVA